MRALAVIPALAFGAMACGGQAEEVPRPQDATPLMVVVADPTGPAAADLRAGRPSAARARLETSLKADPDGLAAMNDLGVTYEVEERTDAARQLLEDVLNRGDAREQQLALVNLAELHALDGYVEAARVYLAAAFAIDPSRPEPLFALALLEDAKGDRAASQSALRAALAADPGGQARRGLVFVFPEERQHLEALVAEASGDPAQAAARWRELARGRFPVLAATARRNADELRGVP